MSALVHYRLQTKFLNQVAELSRAFHIVDNSGARVLVSETFDQQHEQAVCRNDVALIRHQADTIAITIKSQPQIGVFIDNR